MTEIDLSPRLEAQFCRVLAAFERAFEKRAPKLEPKPEVKQEVCSPESWREEDLREERKLSDGRIRAMDYLKLHPQARTADLVAICKVSSRTALRAREDLGLPRPFIPLSEKRAMTMKIIRENPGLSPSALAELAGVSRGYVWDVLNDPRMQEDGTSARHGKVSS